MSKSTMSDVGPCFSFTHKKRSKDQASDILVLFILVLCSIFSLNRVVELLRQDIMPLVRKQKKTSR